MPITEYSIALKRGQKAYRQDVADGRQPYLKVLDEILEITPTAGETDLGLVEIPMDRIAGTKTAGRTRAFASNFMPLIEAGEFADKWSNLYRAHVKEGTHEHILTHAASQPLPGLSGVSDNQKFPLSTVSYLSFL